MTAEHGQVSGMPCRAETALGVVTLPMQQMAGLVTENMAAHGTKFLWRRVPRKVEKLPSGSLQVTWAEGGSSHEEQDTFDTVLWAVGELGGTRAHCKWAVSLGGAVKPCEGSLSLLCVFLSCNSGVSGNVTGYQAAPSTDPWRMGMEPLSNAVPGAVIHGQDV